MVGCGASVIPNTDVEDNSANREIVEFVERYRLAVEARDVGVLMRLASPSYFDDNGTPSGDDDVDFDGLRSKLAGFTDNLLAVRYEIRYRRVTYRRDEVAVDYTYTGSFRVTTATGDRWARRLADNRLVLRREGDQLRIVSGM
ncbi:MAG: hypothetical protein IPK60_09790 [Sandaracinaceae bacterium]|nr:hypothetical protein [Sandaracinaceae bacterium]